MSEYAPVGDLVEYVIGGGWGDEDPADDSVPVSVIRGADFPSVSHGDVSTLPKRYETQKRMDARRLHDGDIVLEISGGTKDRPTGRAAYVPQRLIDGAAATLIPASFCRLLRPNRSIVEPRYLHYWLQDMYAAGRTWSYQVQSTGLANFQMQMFLERERVRLPTLEDQRRIAGVLGALDDLIDTNRGIAESCTALWRAFVRASLADAAESAPLSELADFVNGKNFTKEATGHGRPVIRTPEVRRGPERGTARSDVDAADENIAREGDTLFVWSGSLTVGRWMWEEGLINQHVFKVLSNPDVPAWLVFALLEYQMPWFLSLAADKATTMGHIKREHLDATVPVPSQLEISRLGGVIEPLWDEALQCGIAIQQLTRIRNDLLPLLLSGRVQVDAATESLVG